MALEHLRRVLGGAVANDVDLADALRVVAELAGGPDKALALAADVWRQEDQPDEPSLQLVADWAANLGPQPVGHVAKLIPPNSVFLLAGKPKSGKTFLAIEIADAVASGDHVLGLKTKQGPVCYFSMEDSPWQFKERLAVRGTLERNPDFYIYKGRKDVSTPDGVLWLEQKVAPIVPSLIVLDTARQAFGMANWNDAAEVTARLRPLMDLAGRLPNGGSILLVAHANKNPLAEGGDRISGSNALQSAVDCYMILDKVKRNDEADLEGEADCQGRIEMPPKFTWVMNRGTLHFRVVDKDEQERVQRGRDVRDASQRIVQAIRELDGEATCEDIGKHLGVSSRYAREQTSAAARAGRIEVVRTIQTGKTTAKVWGVTLANIDGGTPPTPPYSSAVVDEGVDDMAETDV